MRNIFSIAACALALTCAGTAQAANEADTVSSVTNQITGRLQQLAQFVQGNPASTPKSQAAFDAGSNRSRTAATAPAPAPQAEEQTGQAMLLAGLLVMGVIIKRRYGKRD